MALLSHRAGMAALKSALSYTPQSCLIPMPHTRITKGHIMSAKTSPARRAAFLKALAETGNHTIAAAHARVSRSWVTLHKTNDPAFRAAWDAAVAQAVEAARAGGTSTPSAKWTFVGGEEMVVRAGNGRRAVVSRARLKQWTPRVEEAFLSTLAATCNVKLACAATGLSPASAYVRRHKWPGFAERWKAALETGYTRLEYALVENACNTLTGERDFTPDAPMPPVAPDQAIQLLRLHRYAVRGVGKPLSMGIRPADPEAARAEIMRAVAAVKRGRATGLITERRGRPTGTI